MKSLLKNEFKYSYKADRQKNYITTHNFTTAKKEITNVDCEKLFTKPETLSIRTVIIFTSVIDQKAERKGQKLFIHINLFKVQCHWHFFDKLQATIINKGENDE